MAPRLTGRRAGRVRPRRAGTLATVLTAAVALAVAGCAELPAVTFPPSNFVPSPPSAALDPTIAAVTTTLAAQQIAVRPAQVPFRPGESASMASAPRTVLQTQLPEDPGEGFIVVYEFPDAASAAAAGAEMAAYVRSGPGQVQFVPDTRFVLRQVGQTLVFFPWSPANATDPRLPDVAAALETIGTEIPIGP